MGSVGVLARRSVVAALALLVTSFSCQPPAPPEKLVGRGVVQKIVPADRRVVIAHEEIPGFMGAMTMSFEVGNPALLEQLAPGERVRFTLEKTEETLYLVAIEPDSDEARPPTVEQQRERRAHSEER